ncbi:MAG: carbamoyl-phosphate synthase (glutamine-hydrolyzing) large subunit [Clostridiales bacterium]
MPKRKEIKKVLVIGSGPIIIGQAAEFDYSGSQACRSLMEEGIEVILINSNPATIMTDKETADKIYIEPLTLEFVKKVIFKEKPDGILATLGGQTGLNIATQLVDDGILDKFDIELLGTSPDSIKRAEDRELFRKTMLDINENIPQSIIINNINDGMKFIKKLGFPIIIRPAYTLGGTGSGIAENMDEFINICSKGLQLSMINQVLLEQCVSGWKEIEYEVMRDGNDNCITICNMENFDPVGVHTGDSIVIAPSQTLSDKEYQMLRTASIKIIRNLKIKGGCNIQFALHPKSFNYVVIEVNPRLSRSSALASKATGYPIARVAAKIAIGYSLDEIKNSVTQSTSAFFEPALDYVVTKVPRWPFDKFVSANKQLGTQMKSTGEVMAIGRTFEESLLKAIDSLDIKLTYQLGLSLFENKSADELSVFIKKPTNDRIFAICKALQKGVTVKEIVSLTGIDEFFIFKLSKIVELASEIQNTGIAWLDYNIYSRAKKMGFGDSYISNLVNVDLNEIRALKSKYPIKPVYKIVDTCAGEFEAKTPYYYSTYEEDDDDIKITGTKKILVIGSGPIRIGQGIEFDYCSVNCVKKLKELGFESIIINNNPETVSTDFDTSDKLYFEPLTKECILDIITKEKPMGIIVQFGGQTAINLAYDLKNEGVNILGTSIENIDLSENRERFLNLLSDLKIPLPLGKTAFSLDEAINIASEIGYPVLVRPSYVLGGRAMEIINNDKTLVEYMKLAVDISTKHPILIDKYINGKEIEVDGICDGNNVLIPGIMEHIERAGIHSGDSFAVYPPQKLSNNLKNIIVDYSIKIAQALNVIGLFNIQFVIDNKDRIYVLEVNPRASRTVPILSKITGIPMVNIATQLIMGKTLKDLNYQLGLAKESKFIAVKAPVFSFSKITDLDTYLGPEMKSTGEVMGVDKDYNKALYKAFISAGYSIPTSGNILISLSDFDKKYSISMVKTLINLNFSVLATTNTYKYLLNNNIDNVELISYDNALELLKDNKLVLIINTPRKGKNNQTFGYSLRRISVEYNINCITSIDTANAFINTIKNTQNIKNLDVYPLNNYNINYLMQN